MLIKETVKISFDNVPDIPFSIFASLPILPHSKYKSTKIPNKQWETRYENRFIFFSSNFSLRDCLPDMTNK
jgi:hypothetical protein